jgi:hypothetical protein
VHEFFQFGARFKNWPLTAFFGEVLEIFSTVHVESVQMVAFDD